MRAAVVSSRQQLNRLNSVERDRGAADKSTESVRSRDPGQRERGSRRSGERFLCRFLLARRRRSAGLSQFVERYRRVGKPFSVLPVLQIICRKCSTRAFTAFSVSELVGADNEGPTPPPRSQISIQKGSNTMNLRRTIATLLAALMLLALTACGAGTTPPAQDPYRRATGCRASPAAV